MRFQQGASGMYWHPYFGWTPVRQWTGYYPGQDGEIAGTMSRSVVGQYVQRRASPQGVPQARIDRPAPRDELSGGYDIMGTARRGGHHGMHGYDIVGEAAARAAWASQQGQMPQGVPQNVPPMPYMPQFQTQWGQAPRESGQGRRLTMPFQASVSMATLTTGQLYQLPQEPIRVERLFLDTAGGTLTGLVVQGIFVGQQSQLTASGSMPANQFANNSVGGTLRGDTANPGIAVLVNLLNGTAGTVIALGSVVGEAMT